VSDRLLEARNQPSHVGGVRRIGRLAQIRLVQRDRARFVTELPLTLRDVVEQRRLRKLVIRRLERFDRGGILAEVVLLGRALGQGARFRLIGIRRVSDEHGEHE
jgi:hypothetical protein